MNTTLAFLPRLLPGVFGRPPTATSAGYRLPHERFFFAGIAFSATLHVAVLFGFNTPRPGGDVITVALPDPVTPLGMTELDLERLAPPEVKAETEKKTESAEPELAGEERATIAEPMIDASDRFISVTIDRVPPAVRPDAERKNWKVPDGPPPGAKISKDAPWDPKDLEKVPVATSRAAPRYPFEMKRLGVGGTALLRFIVDNRGNVSDVEVIRADREEFGKAAAEAMLRWKFSPGMKNGRRVNTRMEMPMTFSLEKGA